MQMLKAFLPGTQEETSSSLQSGKVDAKMEMDDSEKAMATVAQLIEQLHAKTSSPQDKELTTARLLGIAKGKREARRLIGSYGQAMPLFISMLRNGTSLAKVNVASILCVLCKDKDLRLKVLLGGCIPPLLSVLKSGTIETRKAAAEAIYEVSSAGISSDHIGMKIFITEGVVPTLWDQLSLKGNQDKVVEGYVTGALRNLCGVDDGYWRLTLEGSGVDIVVSLLSSDNPNSQANAASLLARLVLSFCDSIQKILNSGVVKSLIQLLEQKNDINVRASAADALEALSSKSDEAKKCVKDAGGVHALIEAIVAPSKECMQGKHGQSLQEHATGALANVFGGMRHLIIYLGEVSQSPRLTEPIGDVIGALAYALMIFKQPESSENIFDPSVIESILVKLLKPRDTKLIQERILEAMASLYGNSSLSCYLDDAEAKRVLIALITMASADVRERLIICLSGLCHDKVGIWEAIGKREGIQLFISFLGLSSEQHQEYAVEMLKILTAQVDDSKWAVTAAGGIPPLVQLLETGSQKAKEDAACILWNLCCHSEEIRDCVERAGGIPAFLWLLKTGGPNSQETSAKALVKLVHTADPATINQLLALLLGDDTTSKIHVIKVLGHVLSKASQEDLVHRGCAANKGLRSLVESLSSSREETKEHTASVLADLFSSRQDICGHLATDDIINPWIKLLTNNTQNVAKQVARALDALSRPVKKNNNKKKSYIAEGDIKSLIKLAKNSSIESAENAISALANLLSDPDIAAEALAEDVVSAFTRILADGSPEGKRNASRALHQLLRNFPICDVLKGSAQCRFAILSLVDSLKSIDVDSPDAFNILEVVALLVKTKSGVNFSYPPWIALAEVPSSLETLVQCLTEGHTLVQDKAIEVLSRLCSDQQFLLSELIVSRPKSMGVLADRIVNASSLEVRVGGTALLLCAAKEKKQLITETLDQSGFSKLLLHALIDMIKHNSTCFSLETEVQTPKGFLEKNVFQDTGSFYFPDPAKILGGTVALWLLCILTSVDAKSKVIVMEAGGLEVLLGKLVRYTSSPQAEFEDTEGIWISALLLAIMFQDDNVSFSSTTMRIIPTLAVLLGSDELIDRYFAAHAMASLVCTRNRGINLTIANSGAVSGIINLVGYVESEILNLDALANEFSLVKEPDQVILQHLFEIEDVRLGSTARKSIPLLVDLLRPIPDRPGAPQFAVQILIRIADGSDTNKLLMAEAGAVEALTKYLSLSPQDSTEYAISELLRILFSNHELRQNEMALSSLNQLIAVLRLGSRSARYSAAGALNELFDAENIRNSEIACQAVQPLMDILGTVSESEQEVALSALIKLSSENTSNTALLIDVEGCLLENVIKILSSASASDELKINAATLCSVVFSNKNIRTSPSASGCVKPLITLMQSERSAAVEAAVCAIKILLDDEQHLELAAAHNILELLVGLVSGRNYVIIEASLSALIKLGKDRVPRKLDMVEAGIIERCLELLPGASSSLCSAVAELFRILTNSGVIARRPDVAKTVEPLFTVLLRSDLTLWGQHSALQALVNILEKQQSLEAFSFTPSEAIVPLISFLESSSQAIQQLGAELLSHFLTMEDFQQDITTQSAVVPLVRLAGIGILSLQETAIKALEKISASWPKAVLDAGGIFELSKVILQEDPQPPLDLWESAAFVLSNIVQYDAECFFRVELPVLVKLLFSTIEGTVLLALKALMLHEKNDASSTVQMAELGAIDALLDLLRSHQCEEESGSLLEVIFNNPRVRELKLCKYAIAPLSQYLLDPQTRSEPGRLLAALALGDLSQHEGLSRSSGSVSACRALISVLEEQPTEEMKVVAICALQNFVMNSRTNRRAVAEAGGVLLIQELLLSCNAEVSGQAALMVKFLFSNHTLQEYVSNELIRSLTAALERGLWSTATINIEVLRTLNVIFSNFPKLRASEAATFCIPHLVGALKSGVEDVQGLVLDILYLLRHSWTNMSIDVAKSQAMIAAEAIPVLQMLMKTCPPRFHDKADSLLHCLPGCLTVNVMRANNLKQSMATTNAFCQLTIGNCPPRQTKVVSNSTTPEWKEGFTWAFDVPPKGQKLHIICKSKSTFGKTTLGRVTIQIDKVVTEGEYSGSLSLNHENSKDTSSRSLDIEIAWSNRTTDETH
ncbi:C2 domain [Arabidopsis thaliana x Arabidopsis arenosa]|uniref:C2 domain n=1 Tax=Arabidopsis thaliana x Arabidopsis arenosa TaxID=1240361 RepID=A0A8T2BP92_9BRAS|nr:C2 domain [Arabidopsis thaliana x Arabidopsis arenosa]